VSGATILQDVLTQVEPSTDGAPLGTVSVRVDEADPRLGDGASLDMPRRTASGDVVPAPRSSCAMGLEIAKLLLSSSPGPLSLPVNWGVSG
jgi:hypothetical protein